MRRIVRTEALCLQARPHRESSKLVFFLTPDDGRLVCTARGARRVKSRFGAALDQFATSDIIFFWHEARQVYTLTDAELVTARRGLAAEPARFLAAQQVTEFLFRTGRPHDANPQLYRLANHYLDRLEAAAGTPRGLVGSFLLKAASFLGFRPELRCCLRCRRAVDRAGSGEAWQFDPVHGGAVCPDCAGEGAAARLAPAAVAELAGLLHERATDVAARELSPEQLGLVLAFVNHHIDPLLLNSFNWQEL
jgi:DNA repair protein RecO (recombination protein O)